MNIDRLDPLRALGIPSSRHFGVEFELTAPRHSLYSSIPEIVSFLQNQGLECQYASRTDKRVADYWKVVHDGSISCSRDSPDCLTFELVSPKLKGGSGFKEVHRALQAVQQLNPSVNSSAGFHVHIEHSKNDFVGLRKLVQQFVKYEDVFDLLLPGSRRGNTNEYCKSIRRTNFAGCNNRDVNEKIHRTRNIRELIHLVNPQESRYFKLNLVPMLHQGTIEFRLHSATYTYEKASCWILLLMRFTEHACSTAAPDNFMDHRTPKEKFHPMFQWIIKDRYLWEYYLSRTEQVETTPCCSSCNLGGMCNSK